MKQLLWLLGAVVCGAIAALSGGIFLAGMEQPTSTGQNESRRVLQEMHEANHRSVGSLRPVDEENLREHERALAEAEKMRAYAARTTGFHGSLVVVFGVLTLLCGWKWHQGRPKTSVARIGRDGNAWVDPVVRGDLAQGEQLLLALVERTKDVTLKAKYLGDLGLVLHLQGRLDEAEAFLRQAERTEQRGPAGLATDLAAVLSEKDSAHPELDHFRLLAIGRKMLTAIRCPLDVTRPDGSQGFPSSVSRENGAIHFHPHPRFALFIAAMAKAPDAAQRVDQVSQLFRRSAALWERYFQGKARLPGMFLAPQIALLRMAGRPDEAAELENDPSLRRAA